MEGDNVRPERVGHRGGNTGEGVGGRLHGGNPRGDGRTAWFGLGPSLTIEPVKRLSCRLSGQQKRLGSGIEGRPGRLSVIVI